MRPASKTFGNCSMPARSTMDIVRHDVNPFWSQIAEANRTCCADPHRNHKQRSRTVCHPGIVLFDVRAPPAAAAAPHSCSFLMRPFRAESSSCRPAAPCSSLSAAAGESRISRTYTPSSSVKNVTVVWKPQQEGKVGLRRRPHSSAGEARTRRTRDQVRPTVFPPHAPTTSSFSRSVRGSGSWRDL